MPAVFVAALVCGCSPKFTEFTFVQMTDPQIGFRDNTSGFRKSDSLFNRAAEAVNALNPKCVIITGDLINDAYDTLQDSIYRANRGKIKVPVYEIPGNHDIRPWTPVNHSHYLQQRGYERFSFRLGGCAFIGFDSNCIKDGQEKLNDAKAAARASASSLNRSSESRASSSSSNSSSESGTSSSSSNRSSESGTGKAATLSEEAVWAEAVKAEQEQLKWLEWELRKARRYKYIFVFLHCPVIRESIDEENDYFNFHKGSYAQGLSGGNVDLEGNGGNIEGTREKYIALFKKYGVDVVFAGHTHMDYDTTVEGIRFITAGPVGMPLGRGHSGYEVVTVTKDSVSCRFIPT